MDGGLRQCPRLDRESEKIKEHLRKQCLKKVSYIAFFVCVTPNSMLDSIYWTCFRTFFRIGLFTIGGGYAMVPLIEADVVDKYRWVNREEFLDLMAIAQSCPGIFAVNLSIFIGYKLKGVLGSIVCTLGTILPSFLIILGIALFFQNFRDNKTVESIFKGIRPAVVALIAAPTFKMAKAAKIGVTNFWIPIVGALLIWLFGVSPIYIILLAGISGFLYGHYIRPIDNTDNKKEK